MRPHKRVRVLRQSGAVHLGARAAKLAIGCVAGTNRVDRRLVPHPARPDRAAHRCTPTIRPIASAPLALEQGGGRASTGRRAQAATERRARVRGDRTKVAVLAWDRRPQPVRPRPPARRPAARPFRRRALGRAVRALRLRHLAAAPRHEHPDPSVSGLRLPRVPRLDGRASRASHRRRRDLRLEAALPCARPRRDGEGAVEPAADPRRRRLRAVVLRRAERIDPDELRRARDDPDLALPFGRLWTCACESVVRGRTQLTVSNRRARRALRRRDRASRA